MTTGAKKAQIKYYQEKILIPGINLQRKKYCNFEVAAGTSIPDKATAVAWCDRDLSKIDAIKQLVDLYVENKMIANKQNPAQSGVEQPTDLACMFKVINKFTEHTVWDILADGCPMNKLVSEIFHIDTM
jgi:hypothetical protein